MLNLIASPAFSVKVDGVSPVSEISALPNTVVTALLAQPELKINSGILLVSVLQFSTLFSIASVKSHAIANPEVAEACNSKEGE